MNHRQMNAAFWTGVIEGISHEKALIVFVIGITEQGNPVTVASPAMNREQQIELLEIQLEKLKTEKPISTTKRTIINPIKD